MDKLILSPTVHKMKFYLSPICFLILQNSQAYDNNSIYVLTRYLINTDINHSLILLFDSFYKENTMPIVNNLQISINTKCSPNNLSTSDRLPIFKLIQTKSSSIHQGWETAIFFLVRLNYQSDERDLCVTPPPPSSLVSSNDPLSNVTYRGGDQTLLYFNPGH